MDSMNFLTYISILCYFTIASANVIVETKLGKVSGKQVKSIIPNEEYYSFLGIPYAQPPVGDLRFRPPKPHPGWNNILEAKKERKPCSQFNLPERNIKRFGYCGDEDCLYLSIHTPKLPESNLNLASLVFLYNENFRISNNGSKDYRPDFLMTENVILITIQHRLGSLGFLSFQDEVLPGNNGIRDVLLALHWIQDNIKYFGGNPSKITLMGHSGGACIVDILLHSAKAEGLFSGVILQSGSSWNPMYFEDNTRKKAKNLGEIFEGTVTTGSYLIKQLAEQSAQIITESEHLVVHADDARAIQRAVVIFGPTIENDHPDAVITYLPELSKRTIKVPIMIGYNSREGIEMSERLLLKPRYLTFADRDFLFMFPIRVNYHFKINDKVYYEAIEKIKEFYFDEGYIKISKPGEYVSYIGDVSSFYPIDYTVRHYVNRTSTPIYYYMFDYSGELNMRKKSSLEEAVNIDGTWGASVGDELCYLFVCNPKNIYKQLLDDEESEEIKVMKNMVRMWSNFAKTGNPTPPGEEFIWKPATKENKECLVISEELKMRNNLHADVVKFWDDFILYYKEKAVNGTVQDIRDEL